MSEKSAGFFSSMSVRIFGSVAVYPGLAHMCKACGKSANMAIMRQKPFSHCRVHLVCSDVSEIAQVFVEAWNSGG